MMLHVSNYIIYIARAAAAAAAAAAGIDQPEGKLYS
jgi:hypothetical protein